MLVCMELKLMEMFVRCFHAFLIAFLSFLPGCCPTDMEVFRNPHDSHPFQHLVVDRLNTGRVYIGAVNRLYELRSDLQLKSDVTTGPREDSVDCLGPSRDCTSTEPTDNYNKALAIVGKMSKLVECSSLYQGRCRLRNLYNIAQSGNDSGPIVANDLQSSTVVFVAPGPPDPSKNDVLYVASTYTDSGAFRDEIPAVASLSLNVGRMFSVVQKSIKGQTQIFVERSKRKSYKIEYVTGFSSGNFAYFITRQPKLDTGPSRVLSKLVRLCHNDSNYYSYTEIPLVCRKNRINYNLVQDAYVARPGFDLARSLNVTTEDDVLFAVFSEGDKQNSLANQPTKNSALCVYSLRSIEKKFLENIELCNRGEALTGLEYLGKNRKCFHTPVPGRKGHFLWKRSQLSIGG